MSLQEVVVSWLAAQSFHDKTCPVATLLLQAAGLSRRAAGSAVACSVRYRLRLARNPYWIWSRSSEDLDRIRVQFCRNPRADFDRNQQGSR